MDMLESKKHSFACLKSLQKKVIILCCAAIIIGFLAGMLCANVRLASDMASARPLSLMPAASSDGAYFHAYTYSYFAFDSETGYQEAPAFVETPATLKTDRTAYIIIDPWCDAGSSYLNAMITKAIDEYVLPLANRFADCGARIIIATNKPPLTPNAIDYRLQSLVDSGLAEIVYHQDLDTPEKIVALLESVDTLVFAGFAANMCVLFRPLGIISLYSQFSGDSKKTMYFVPEATAGVAFTNDADNIRMRDDICITLAQNHIASLVRFDDLAAYLRQIDSNKGN